MDYTIEIMPNENMICRVGKLPKARHMFSGGGLNFYVKGAIVRGRRDLYPALANLVLNTAIGAGVKAIDIRAVKGGKHD